MTNRCTPARPWRSTYPGAGWSLGRIETTTDAGRHAKVNVLLASPTTGSGVDLAMPAEALDVRPYVAGRGRSGTAS